MAASNLPKTGLPEREDFLSERREALEKRLCESYRAYFDVEMVEDDPSLKARCAYHFRESQYVLVKNAELWAAENHEYLYLHSLDKLDAAAVERVVQAVLEDGTPRVKPHAEHRFTYLTAMILCDQAAPDALEMLKKVKKRREFKLSLHGWMELRIAAVDLSTGEISTNRCARDLSKSLRPFVDTVLKSI